MWWHWEEGMGWWMLFGGFWMLFWAAIIGLIVWGIKKLTERGRGEPSRRDALDIARERYARGEITREQYEQIKRDLTER